MVVVALLILMTAGSVVGQSSTSPFAHGESTWDLATSHVIYIDGPTADEVVLTRQKPNSALSSGSVDVPYSPAETQVMSAQSPPTVVDVDRSLNLSIRMAVIHDGPTETYCRTSNFATPLEPQETWIRAQVLVNGTPIYDERSEAIVLESRNQDEPEVLQTQQVPVNLSMRTGEVLTLNLYLTHHCKGTQAIMLWGGDGEFRSGLHLEGPMIQPSLEVNVDDAGLLHIQLVPDLPWGWSSIASIDFDIRGPTLPDGGYPDDLDLLIDSFEPTPVRSRINDRGELAYTWTTRAEMPVGHSVLRACIYLTDENPDPPCHLLGDIHIVRDAVPGPLLNAAAGLLVLEVVAVSGLFVLLMRQGLVMPMPMLFASVAMILLAIPAGFAAPDLDMEASKEIGERIQPFALSRYGGDLIDSDVLLSEGEALIISTSLPGSTNALDHAAELRDLIESGVDVQVVQIVTGEGADMTDVMLLSEQLGFDENLSWPLGLDEHDGSVAASLPTGVGDGIVVVDRSGHIVGFSSIGMSNEEMQVLVEQATGGGAQSAGRTLRAVFTIALPLLMVSLPSTPKEEDLAPSSLATVMHGGLGVSIVLMPMAIATAMLGGPMLVWFDVLFATWLLTMGVQAAWSGGIAEMRLVVQGTQRILPVSMSGGGVERFERDVTIGAWCGWFLWLIRPGLFEQTVVAPVLAGSGVLMAPLLLIGQILVVGTLVLLLRWIAASGGRWSRLGGDFGSVVFGRACGCMFIAIGAWMMLLTALATPLLS